MRKKEDTASLTVLDFRKECFCLNCGDSIINPISINKLFIGFKQWMVSYPKLYTDVKSDLLEYMKKNNDIRKNICPHCFSKYLFSLIKEAGAGVRIMSEFLFIFNFDFNFKENISELELYGGY